jgi:predicted Zn-dependent protease
MKNAATNPHRAARQPANQRRIPRFWLLASGLALVAVIGPWATITWRRSAAVAHLQASLPSRPDLSDRTPVLGELLSAAHRLTGSPRSMIEGVAELGRLYHANGFNREAAQCWEVLRREQPGEARWPYYLADLNRIASDYPAMTGLLRETLRLAPDYTPARLQLANLLFKSGDAAEAERHYRLRLEAIPKDAHARLGLVRLALQRQRPDEARAMLEMLLRDAPHFATGHNLYAEILASAGEAEGAARHRWLGRETLRFRDADDPWLDELQAWCHDYDRLCVFGTIELQTERLDRAQELFERAIRTRPDEPHAYEMLGSLLLKRNDVTGARDLFEKALPRLTGKKAPGVFTALSLVYGRLEQPAEAIRVARDGLAHEGDQPELLDALGQALAQAGEHEKALQAWEAALALNPRDANLNHNAARSLLALHRLDDALAALDRSLTRQPSFLPTLLLRGQIELEAGHLTLAEKYLRPAFEFHPHDAQARRLLADWHQRMGAEAESKGDRDGAERRYRDGLAIDTNHAELSVSLGVFYLVHGRFADAIAPLSSYHQLQPENAQACLFLGQAYASSGDRANARTILTRGVELAERTGLSRVANHCRRILQQL